LINRIDDFICGGRGESSQWLPHLEVDPYLHSPCHIAIYILTFFPLTHNLLHTASHSSPSHTHINGCLTFVPLTHSLTFITLSLTFVPLTHSLTFVPLTHSLTLAPFTQPHICHPHNSLTFIPLTHNLIFFPSYTHINGCLIICKGSPTMDVVVQDDHTHHYCVRMAW